jgi:HPt (histidine-containing phosphotransfer) domain-containing protein
MGQEGFFSNSVTTLVNQQPLRRRFRAGDVARYMDMQLVGELCLAVTVEGFMGLMDDFWADASRQLQPLLSALEQGAYDEAVKLAHTLKGVADTLGCVGVAAMARGIEKDALQYKLIDARNSASMLREQWESTHALCSQAGFTRISTS